MKFLATTALAGLLAAQVAASAAHATDLRMSWWGGDSRHVATQEALKACGAKYGVTVSPEFTGFDGYLEKLTTQMAGGTEADIVQVNWPWLPLFSKKGDGFYDMNQLKDIIDLSQYAPADLASVTINGKLNGLPVSTTGRVFFFNTAALSAAGITPPATWDEFFAAAKTLKDKTDDKAYLFNAVKETAQLLVTLKVVQDTGKDLVDPETGKVAWTEDELTRGIEFYGKLVSSGAVMAMKDEAAEGNVNLYEKQAWAKGMIDGSYEWDSTYDKFAKPMEAGQVLDSVAFIKDAGAKTDGVYRKPSMIFAISKHSKDPKAAAQIVNCLLNEPEGIDALGDTRGIPSSKVAAARLEAAGKISPAVAKAHQIVMEASGPTVSPFNEHPEIRSNFLDTMEQYAYGQISAADAADQIIYGTNKVLKKFD